MAPGYQLEIRATWWPFLQTLSYSALEKQVVLEHTKQQNRVKLHNYPQKSAL